MKDNRFKLARNSGIFGIIGNIFLLIIKGIVGFSFNSQAMIADSFNSAGDIFASLMTFIGNKIASVPNDKDHNFGHGKAEYIFSMFIGLSMVLVFAKLFYNSISSLVLGNKLKFSWSLVIVCLITICVKLFLYLYTKNASKRCKNILITSNMKDHRNDCIVTFFTLISILLTKFNIFWFDGTVGIGISIWIGYTGVLIFLESYNVLMDISVDKKTEDSIIKIINNFNEIKKVEAIYSTPVGSNYIIFITICVDGNLSTFKSHEIANLIEDSVSKLDNVYKAMVHVEPV